MNSTRGTDQWTKRKETNRVPSKLFVKAIYITSMLLIVQLLFSCAKQTPYDIFEEHEREIVKNSSISKIIETEVGLDTVGNPIWKRVNKIKVFDKNGLLLMMVEPKYVMLPSNKSQSAETDFLKRISTDFLKRYRTDIPNGKADTTVYKYDEADNLVEEKEGVYTTKYKYDKFENVIEKCTLRDYAQAVCNYTTYTYDIKNRIHYKIDSTNEIGRTNGHYLEPFVQKSVYKYDKKGRVVFDGKYNRVFNDANQLIEVSEFENSDMVTESYKYSYAKNGNRTSMIYTKKTEVFSTDRELYYYNEENLLSQKKTLDENNNLIILFNYEYIHF